ncbi:hypothetical protein JG687_00007624 [Phytophthora cactorum]|uniref:Uncharacterized protein n=1 Tax=Phytophthora cactorum TaxID=29920 RepID=A0A8T1UJT4_9STRA|nr:hypothetical protein JG687_00007624 [Phytophthora cactorum]
MSSPTSSMVWNRMTNLLRCCCRRTIPRKALKLLEWALKRVDSARYRVIEEANSLVAAAKKLRFFIAKLSNKDYNRLGEAN